MKMNKENINKINTVTESSYITVITAIVRHAPKLLERGANWSLILLPVAAFIKASLYWHKTKQPGYSDSALKTALNKLYYGGKVIANIVGVGLAIAGLATIGFGVIIAAGYIGVARYLGKAVRSGIQGNVQKVGNNLTKALVGGLISGGFTLMTFFPPMALLGATMVFAATAFILLATAPGMMAELTVKPKYESLNLVETSSHSSPGGAQTSSMYRPSLASVNDRGQLSVAQPHQRMRANSL